VQKFTKSLTREIELGGQRLALTLSAEGVSVRPVGSRATPREIGWAAVLCAAAGGAADPTEPQVTAALAALRKPPGGKKAAPAAASDKKGETADAAAEPSAPASGKLQELLARLEKWLAQHRKHLLEDLRPGANELERHALQAKLGGELPDELRTLLAWHNGQKREFAGGFEEDGLLLGTEEVAEAKAELDRGAAGNGAGNGWQAGWIPFLDDDSGNYVFLDTSQSGAPVRVFWLGKKEQPTLAPSLTAWFEEFVSAVEAGKYVEEPERGTFMRRKETK
jgi:cell wall assembly regulator SMI1